MRLSKDWYEAALCEFQTLACRLAREATEVRDSSAAHAALAVGAAGLRALVDARNVAPESEPTRAAGDLN